MRKIPAGIDTISRGGFFSATGGALDEVTTGALEATGAEEGEDAVATSAGGEDEGGGSVAATRSGVARSRHPATDAKSTMVTSEIRGTQRSLARPRAR